MLPVNKDTEVEFVELRVWSRTSYLILRILDIQRLVSMKALRDQDGGLRAGSPHRWSQQVFYQPIGVKMSTVLAG